MTDNSNTEMRDLADDTIIAPQSTTRVLRRHQLIFNKSPVRLLIFAPPGTLTSISKSVDSPALRKLSYILGGIGNSRSHKRPMWFAKDQATL